jgi:hypothetical protein
LEQLFIARVSLALRPQNFKNNIIKLVHAFDVTFISKHNTSYLFDDVIKCALLFNLDKNPTTPEI